MQTSPLLTTLLVLGFTGCAELESFANRSPERRPTAREDAAERRATREASLSEAADDHGAREGSHALDADDSEQAAASAIDQEALRALGYTGDGEEPEVEMVTASQALPTGDPGSSALLLEKVTPKEVLRGVEFDYLIRLTNLTDQPLEGVRVEDEVSSNLKLVSGEPAPQLGAAGVASWDVGTLQAGQVMELRARAVAGEGDAVQTMAQAEFRQSLKSTIAVIAPALAINVGMASGATPGANVPVRVEVQNTGTGFARGVRLSGELPDGLTTTDGASEIDIPVRDLGTGESEIVQLVLRANGKGNFQPKLAVQMRGGDPVMAEVGELIVQQASLALSIKGPERAFIKSPARWDMTVSNTGEIAARAVEVSTAVPAGMKLVRAEDANVRGESISWTLGDLPAGQTTKVSLYLEPEVAGTAEVSATVMGEGIDAVEGSTSTATEGLSDLTLNVTDLQDPVLVGDSLTYHVEVTNQGTAEGKAIQVSVELEDGMVLVRTDGATSGAGNIDTNKVSFNPLTKLAPNDTATWVVVVRAEKPGDLVFKATMSGEGLPRPVADEEGTKFYE